MDEKEKAKAWVEEYSLALAKNILEHQGGRGCFTLKPRAYAGINPNILADVLSHCPGIETAVAEVGGITVYSK